jgi:hypothetical protein
MARDGKPVQGEPAKGGEWLQTRRVVRGCQGGLPAPAVPEVSPKGQKFGSCNDAKVWAALDAPPPTAFI